MFGTDVHQVVGGDGPRHGGHDQQHVPQAEARAAHVPQPVPVRHVDCAHQPGGGDRAARRLAVQHQHDPLQAEARQHR